MRWMCVQLGTILCALVAHCVSEKGIAKGFGAKIRRTHPDIGLLRAACKPVNQGVFEDPGGERSQVVCLVFDQFEELYSKPELFPVFEEAQRSSFRPPILGLTSCLALPGERIAPFS